MNPTFQMQDEQVIEIVAAVAGAVLGAEAGPVRMASLSLPVGDTSGLTAYVTISGAWNAAVSINCTRDCARNIAATMFGQSMPSLTEGDLRDAIGEICNMVGGNLKSLATSLEGAPCRLSLPLIADGEVRVLGASLIHRSVFTYQGLPVTVQILARSEDTEGRAEPDLATRPT